MNFLELVLFEINPNLPLNISLYLREPVLKISQGLIKGLKRKTIYDHDFYSFEGIPYAQPPLGDLRFKAPVPASGWSDVRDCRESDLKPLQKNHQGIAEGSEDCLYLNVFAKKVSIFKNRGVIKEILFILMTSSYNTKKNYRLWYGFMVELLIRDPVFEPNIVRIILCRKMLS